MARFKIVAETGIAAGVRRVEAVTGGNALAYVQQLEATVGTVAGALKVMPAEVGMRVNTVLDLRYNQSDGHCHQATPVQPEGSRSGNTNGCSIVSI